MKIQTGEKAQFADALEAAPSIPTGLSDGYDIQKLRPGGVQARYGRIKLVKAGGTSDVTLTGAVKVYAVDADGDVHELAQLNGGNDIVLSDGLCYVEDVEDLLSYKRFEVVPAGITGTGTPAYDGHVQE